MQPVPLWLAHITGANSCVATALVPAAGYDVPHKAPFLTRAALRRPAATLLLTGGRDERLTPPEAVELGGEPLLLRRVLQHQGVAPRRMVVYSGSRVTNDNLRAMLAFAGTHHRYERQRSSLQLFEEAFLVRREAAALHAILQGDPIVARAVASVAFRACGPSTFRGLVAAHAGRADIALSLVLGELSRLRRYSGPPRVRTNASATTTSSDASAPPEAQLPAEAARLEPSLADAIDRLWARHRDGLLAAGNALLADRKRLFAGGGAPR